MTLSWRDCNVFALPKRKLCCLCNKEEELPKRILTNGKRGILLYYYHKWAGWAKNPMPVRSEILKMICSAIRYFVKSIYFDPLIFFLNLYPKCSIEENIINTNTCHNQPAFIKAAYNCKTIDIAMPFFMRISRNVFIGVNVTT